MIFGDFHTHTHLCDGKNTPEEMLRAAVDMGLTHYGFSGHATTSYDPSCCMSEEGTETYRRVIPELADRYRNTITVLCGIEQDFFADRPATGYDYVIGSVHALGADAELVVDECPEKLCHIVRSRFGGDWYAMAEAYFSLVARVPELGADVVGHMDLITKFNAGNVLFDETHPRYLEAAFAAVDALIPYDIPFEVNTGAISRGYQTHPYPNVPILRYIAQKGGRVLLSGDAHHTGGICYEFAKWQPELVHLGLTVAQEIR